MVRDRRSGTKMTCVGTLSVRPFGLPPPPKGEASGWYEVGGQYRRTECALGAPYGRACTGMKALCFAKQRHLLFSIFSLETVVWEMREV